MKLASNPHMVKSKKYLCDRLRSKPEADFKFAVKHLPKRDKRIVNHYLRKSRACLVNFLKGIHKTFFKTFYKVPKHWVFEKYSHNLVDRMVVDSSLRASTIKTVAGWYNRRFDSPLKRNNYFAWNKTKAKKRVKRNISAMWYLTREDYVKPDREKIKLEFGAIKWPIGLS